MRGSRFATRPQPLLNGSIPACAGEPVRFCMYALSAQVYPRVCGGASKGQCKYCGEEGLSPRVRGSRMPVRVVMRGLRSIPACAGEPTGYPSIDYQPVVYPRVCGGALYLAVYDQDYLGLSPRVRGSRQSLEQTPGAVGSIPACAGEPT